ncbi:MAG: ABC transporter ATP-binding protein [Deltaproteobacteria bacterium]|nr:ABC transporter ATP-binding protein [Deltaproteobacteria bacterium]
MDLIVEAAAAPNRDLIRIPSNQEYVVEATDICKSYGNGVVTEVLKGFSFQARQGEFLTIFGPSGSGKTTVLNLIGALDLPDSGCLRICGEDLMRMGKRELTRFRANKLGFIFQFYNLLPTLTALENVEAGLEVLGLKRKEIRARANHYLEKVAMADKIEKYPTQLSGGEQQRVAIARALAKEPLLVLADEPTGNLDTKTADVVTSLMKDLIRDIGLTCIVVSHNPGIKQISDRVLYIVEGKAATHGYAD